MNENIIINETLDGAPVRRGNVAAADGTRRTAAQAAGTSATTREARKGAKSDPFIWGIYIFLLLVSMIELFSASSSEVTGSNVYSPLIRHGIFLFMGFGLVLWLQRVHYAVFSRLAVPLAVLSLGLLVYSSFFGAEINNAQRAIKILGFTIQPPEIVKLTVVILLANILGRNQEIGGVQTSAVVTVATVVLVFAGVLWINGLTNTVLIMGISISMFLIGGIQWRKLGVVMAVYGLCGLGLMSVKYMGDHGNEFEQAKTEATSGAQADNAGSGAGRQETHIGRMSRYLKGVHPEDPVDDYNRQVIFANMAQANGGLTGIGPGNSRESARVPLAFSDYIFSILVEETGFIGGAIVLLFYLCLLGRAGVIAYRCKRAFPAFLIMGCAVMIVLQALVHMAIVTGVFPVSGQPLPFISKGGTSILVMSAAIGIMLSVSRYAVTSSDKKELKAELSQLPEGMQASNFSQQR